MIFKKEASYLKNKLLITLRNTLFLLLLIALVQSTFFSANAATSKLQDDIIRSCVDGETVDLSNYQITQEELETVFWDLYYAGKLPWYAKGSFRFQYQAETDNVITFTPELLDPQVYNRVLYEQKIAEIMAATITTSMEDWQKALSIHDYLIARSAYDESLTRTTGYDLLVHGTSVCSGYAQAYMDIMNRAGVDCVYVVSDEMKHGWNLIRIAGSWYHVDLTWNDPTPNNAGTVSHKYFLISDAQMLSEGEEGHYGWKTDITCTSEVLNGTFWKKTENQICYLNNRNSFVRNKTEDGSIIYNRNEFSAQLNALYTVEDKYIDIGKGLYAYPSEGLSMWNNRLYFSDPDTVYSIALDGSDLTTEYRYDTASNGKFILGCFVEKDRIHLTLSDHDFNVSTLELSLPPSNYHVHSYIAAITPATCVNDGYTQYQCDCGLSFRTNTVKAFGFHTYETSVMSEATLFEEGTNKHTCTGCNHTYIEDIPRIPFFKWISDWIKSWFS